MSKKVPDRMRGSTVTDAKELKLCIQGESKEESEDSGGRWAVNYSFILFSMPTFIKTLCFIMTSFQQLFDGA